MRAFARISSRTCGRRASRSARTDAVGHRAAHRRRHCAAGDQHDAACRRSPAPIRHAASGIAQRLAALDPGQRLGGRQHVDAAADQQRRLARARDQCEARFELRCEVGEPGKLGVMARIAVDHGALASGPCPTARRCARRTLARQHRRIPVGRPHQQGRMHRVHGGPLSRSGERGQRRVSGSAPCPS